MSKNLIAGLVALSLVGFGIYAVLTTWVFRSDRPFQMSCAEYLDQPTTKWLRLQNCVLDVEDLVVESDAGDFETLAHRQKGLSQKPYGAPPTWVAAWVPVRPDNGRDGLVRLAYRLDTADVLKWINALERADDRQKERMWLDPVALRRIAKPGLLEGRAEKPSTDLVQRSFGTQASAGMLILTPGKPPVPEPPGLGLAAGLAGLVLLALTARNATRMPHLAESSIEQQLTMVNVSDVKLEIGSLEQVRAEERAGKQRGKRPPHDDG